MLSMEAVIDTGLAMVRYCETECSFVEPVLGSLLVPSSYSLVENPHFLALTWVGRGYSGKEISGIKTLYCPESQLVG